MNEIKLKIWITWAVILFGVGLLADYYFMHIVFHGKQHQEIAVVDDTANPPVTVDTATANPKAADNSFLNTEEDPVTSSGADNFLESLRACAPEVAAQAIATPEALMEYLQKSVGIKTDEISLENYHLTLPDGSLRRVHIISSDNTNNPGKKEIRFFKLDAEGIPERLPLNGSETVESLLALGSVTRHETRSQLELKDSSTVSLEMHDKKVFEFQYNNHGKLLSCRFKSCQCP